MFRKEYYCLVAGLKEYTLDTERKGFDARAVVDDICTELSAGDRRLVELFYDFYDIENLLSFSEGSRRFNPLGNLTQEEIESAIRQPGSMLPTYLARPMRAAAHPDDEEADESDTAQPLAHALYEAWYAACARSKSPYLRSWSAFDRALRNVAAAYGARKRSLPVAGQLVGTGEETDALARSSAADFGLKGELAWIEAVAAALEEPDWVEREHRIDRIRWAMAEDMAVFDYFNVDAILSYLTRLNLVARWVALDEQRGRALYRTLLEGLDGREWIERAERSANE